MKNPKAFPTKNMLFNTRTNNVEVVEHGGMTLLDYFAGQALQGYAANHKSIEEIMKLSIAGKGKIVDIVAKHSYALAKAMLKEREEQNA